MSGIIDLSSVSLDRLGRVVLSEALLDHIERYDAVLSAAGYNTSCGNTVNGGCTNGSCNGTANGSCSNQVSCTSSANLYTCKSNAIEPPTNSGCA